MSEEASERTEGSQRWQEEPGSEPSSAEPVCSSEPGDSDGPRFSDPELEDDDGPDFDSGFCRNCTANLAGSSKCFDCGWAAEDDEQLFDPSPTTEHDLHIHANMMPSLVLAFDEIMELHEEGRAFPHPERPDRIKAILARLLATGVAARCRRVPCRDATLDELACVHTTELIKFVATISQAEGSVLALPPGSRYLMTGDCYANSHTFKCARMAAGGAAEIASLVARGEAPHGAAIVRPPGHHAESGMAMGFCFLNNAAVAARAAQQAGARRILVLDWDVHHGNGTQHIFEDDSSVLFMSLHRYDGGSFYPGSGAAHEVGTGPGTGYTVNVAWNGPGVGNGDYLNAFQSLLLPIAYEYNPDLVIVSAGFDACEGDPIGECRVTPEGFAHMTAMLKMVAPLVLLLEGGYNLQATARATEACLRVMLGEQPPRLPGPRCASPLGAQAVHTTLQHQLRYWRCLRMACAPFLQQQGLLGSSAAALVRVATTMAAAAGSAGGGATAGGASAAATAAAAAAAAAAGAGAGVGELRPSHGALPPQHRQQQQQQQQQAVSSGEDDAEGDEAGAEGDIAMQEGGRAAGGVSPPKDSPAADPHAGSSQARPRATPSRPTGSSELPRSGQQQQRRGEPRRAVVGRGSGSEVVAGRGRHLALGPQAALHPKVRALKAIQRRAIRAFWRRRRMALHQGGTGANTAAVGGGRGLNKVQRNNASSA